MSQMGKIEKIPAYRILANAIMGEILARRLAPGEPLPTEAKLCEVFGVNRSTVREGMRLLEENGVLRRIGAKRLVVSRPSNGEVGDQLERLGETCDCMHCEQSVAGPAQLLTDIGLVLSNRDDQENVERSGIHKFEVL